MDENGISRFCSSRQRANRKSIDGKRVGWTIFCIVYTIERRTIDDDSGGCSLDRVHNRSTVSDVERVVRVRNHPSISKLLDDGGAQTPTSADHENTTAHLVDRSH